MSLRAQPTPEDWYRVWKAHPPAMPGFDQAQSSQVYKALGLDPKVARWAGGRKFVFIVNKDQPEEEWIRIRGTGGLSNADLVREWQRREAEEAVQHAPPLNGTGELERGKRRRRGMLTERQGQPEFRRTLLNAYDGRCAISGVSTREALQAAHIEPYDGPATNTLCNGLLLRADLHDLFDAHLLWIEDDYVVRVADSVADACYRRWDGEPLRVPDDPAARPSVDKLRAHRRECGLA